MATDVVTAEGAAARVSSEGSPFSASWVDHVMRRIEALPGPTWLTYCVLVPLAVLVSTMEGWISGDVVFPEFDAVQATYGLYFVAPIAVLHYLNTVAGEAWDRFRPATHFDDWAAARERYGLTHSPARAGWAALVLGLSLNAAWYLADPVGVQIADKPLVYVALRGLIEGLLSACLLLLVYQVVRQLRIVSRLNEEATSIDLFQPDAVHAMSRLTARSAIGIVLLALLIGLPVGVNEQTWMVTLAVFTAPMLLLALAAFIVPLRGLHRRLEKEKVRLLSAITARMRAASDGLHALVDREAANDDDIDASRAAQTRIDALNKALSSLLQEREVVARLSTWPWDATTFRAVISAVMLPVALFLLTRLLERLVL